MLYRYIVERPGLNLQQQVQIEGDSAYCTIETSGDLVFFRVINGREHMVMAFARGQWLTIQAQPDPVDPASDVYTHATQEMSS